MELSIDAGDVPLPGILTLPAGPVRGAVVVLHGAEAGHGSYFLYAHLARVLPAAGVAVLRYDRRPGVADADIPLATQAADAMAAVDALHPYVGDVPVGLWGLSQGAWSAPLAAAARPDRITFLILVSSCGVSPAAQMRFGTAERLRQHGHGADDLADLVTLRAAVEGHQRGELDRAAAQAVVDRYAGRPWFPLTYVRRQLPDRAGSWLDMDFDPAPVFAEVTCPVLVFYGATDAWMPIEDSVDAWRQPPPAPPAGRTEPRDVTVHRLAGCDHLPTIDAAEDESAISPEYTRAMLAWLDKHLPARAPSAGGPAYRQVIDSLRISYDGGVEQRDSRAVQPWKIAERDRFLDLLRGEGHTRLLEIGAGTGRDSLFFQENGFDVVATDLSSAMVARCRQKGIDARVMDFLSLDFPAASFDAVHAVNCLLHVPNADLPAVLATIRTLLRPGGLFFLGVYGDESDAGTEGIFEHDNHDPPRFFSFRTDEQIQRYANQSFEIVDFHRVDLPDHPFQSLTLRRPG